jgi:hypothetical protein
MNIQEKLTRLHKIQYETIDSKSEEFKGFETLQTQRVSSSYPTLQKSSSSIRVEFELSQHLQNDSVTVINSQSNTVNKLSS